MQKKKKRKLHVKRKHHVSLTPDKGTHVQRTHKDTLFRYIFRDKKKLLELYNAINGTSYKDVNGLLITTLENIIYVGYKNDISFLLDWVLSLIEHQSTWNPNLPLRGVMYFARLYQDYLAARGCNMYGTKKIPLPFPQFVVFFNGDENRPEREVLRLSDAFPKPEHGNGNLAVPALECRALVLNINYGKNQELLNSCKPLLEYSRFIFYIRQNIEAGNPVEKAVDLAVDQSLREGVLTDVLMANRKEVVGMFLEEFDEENFYRMLKRDSLEEGKALGMAQGKAEAILEFLSETGEVPDELRDIIMKQEDLEILRKWVKAAAKTTSIEEFRQQM